MSSVVIIATGSVVAAIAAAIVTFVPSRPRLLKTLAAIAFLGSIISIYGSWWASQEADAAQSELRSASNEIIRLNREIVATVTGGDSFCYVQPFLTDDNHRAALALFHRGDYPVYDVQLRVKDLSRPDPVRKDGTVHIDDILPDLRTIALGNVSGNSELRVPQVVEIGDAAADFNIFFSARNGTWTENLAFRKINDRRTWAYRVFAPDARVIRWARDPMFPESQLPWPVK